MKGLQDELKASQEADRKALEDRRKSINEQIKAEEEKLKRVLAFIDQENLTRVQQPISGANSYGHINLISGEVAGAKRVLGELQALVRAGVLDAALASSRIASLVAIIRSGEAKLQALTQPSNRTRPVAFAKGGVFPLTNASMNPFSANIRYGEEGQELGVILSNKVARIVQDHAKSDLPPVSVTVNRSTDPWRDGQRTRTLIRDVIEETLG